MTSQTLMSLLQLTVHEEIRGLEIFDAYDKMIGKVVGPYEQSSRVVLSCRAYGGYPPPVVKWVSEEGEVLERMWSRHEGGTAPHTSSEGYGHQQQPVSVVSATLHLPPLIREDNGRQLKCVASNTNLTQDRSRVVTINMYLPPLEVKMEGLEKPLRAGVEAPLMCRATGSRPPATLTWQINGSTGLTSHPAQSSLDQNTTIRRGRLLPTPDDNGQSVTCTATNPEVPDYILATTHTLRVHFAPEVRVQLAPALDPRNIKEGDDVYFECQIKANPRESRVVWLHQGHRLHTNKDKGVLAQGRNLVLQKVNRHARGDYQCTVTNTIDTVTSVPTPLDVMFVPECREPRNVTVSVTGTEEVTLNCVVESNPEEVNFVWKVNSSRGVKEMASGSYRSHGRTSTLVYRPHDHAHTQDQYGVVFCLGSNRLGTQKIPCMFIISPAGPPEEPVSCSLVNQSATSLAVACVPGHDGGLTQHFVTTIKDAATQEVVANVSSDTPTFSVGGLAPGRDYLLLVTAANHKGKSSPYVIQGFALKVAENKINNSSSTESSPLLAVFVGVVSGFAFIITVLAVVTRSRCQRRRGRPDAAADNNKLGGDDEGGPPLTMTKTSLDEAEDGDDELTTPESHGGPLEPQELTAQGGGSPGSAGSSRTYVPAGRSQPQPLHSVDLPHITANNHKYYKIKINCTRLNNESFV
ncbi:nephrin-like isoform X2 [Panulirus ornatus]